MADHNIYVGGNNDRASQPSKIYIGDVNDTAQLVSKIYVGNSSNKAVQVWPKLKWDEIYQKCEYLYNTSVKEYINTGVIPDSNTNVILDALKTTTEGSISYNRHFFRASNIYAMYWYKVNNPNNAILYCSFGNYRNVSKNFYPDLLTGRHTYDFNRSGGYFFVDDTYVGQSTNTFGVQGNLQLWNPSSENNPEYDSIKFRLYSCKIYQGNNLIRDLIPCYRKDTLKPGLYDFVNDVFYTNAGSGEFYKGPDVN